MLKLKLLEVALEDQTDESLRVLLEQHWTHCRHLESERAWFMNVYAAIIGGVLAFLATREFGEAHELAIYFLMWITIIGLLLTIRWSKAFEVHRHRVNMIIKDTDSKNANKRLNDGYTSRAVL